MAGASVISRQGAIIWTTLEFAVELFGGAATERPLGHPVTAQQSTDAHTTSPDQLNVSDGLD